VKAFSAHQTARIEAARAEGRALHCPACGAELDTREIAPSEAVSYVRRRLVVACPVCHRHGALDRTRDQR
jgi:hypothetical protein